MTMNDHGIAMGDHAIVMHYRGTSIVFPTYAMVRCSVQTPQSCHGMLWHTIAMPWHVLLQCYHNAMANDLCICHGNYH